MRSLLISYVALSLCCMLTMIYWPSYHERLVPKGEACWLAALWRRRFHDGAEILIWLCLALAFVGLLDWLPGSTLLQSALEAAGSSIEARAPVETGCLESAGAQVIVGVRLDRWLPMLPLQARLKPPSEDCLEGCDPFLMRDAWGEPQAWEADGTATAAHVLQADALAWHRLPTALLALVGGARVSSALAEVLERPEDWDASAPAWRARRAGLAKLLAAQLAVAVMRTAMIIGSLEPSQAGPVRLLYVLAVSLALELAWLPLAALPLHYVRMVGGAARAAFDCGFACAVYWVCTVIALAEDLFKEIRLDLHLELSAPESRSRSDDACAVCLSPLHPEARAHGGPLHVVRTSVSRLWPGVRASSGGAPSRSALVRFCRCGHAIHRTCYLECAGQSSFMPRCPTCRTEFIRVEWRAGVPRWLDGVFHVLWHPIFITVVCRGMVLLAPLFVLLCCRSYSQLTAAAVGAAADAADASAANLSVANVSAGVAVAAASALNVSAGGHTDKWHFPRGYSSWFA